MWETILKPENMPRIHDCRAELAFEPRSPGIQKSLQDAPKQLFFSFCDSLMELLLIETLAVFFQDRNCKSL
jgi:hypothetical protein